MLYLRSKNVISTAIQFKNNLKLISISQYIKTIEKNNYNKDDNNIIAEFLNTSNSTKKQNISVECNEPFPSVSLNDIAFNNIELNILHNIIGYIIANIKKNMITCDKLHIISRIQKT